MKLGRFLFSGLVLAGLLVYPSCRKADTLLQDQSQVKNTTDHKFFNEHRSADARENALIRFLKRKNDSLHFVQKTVEKIGYPRWDKGMVISGQGLQGLTATDSSFFVYIPFVKESQNHVNASMIISVAPGDTSFSYLCDWQYRSLGFDTATTTRWNARTAFQLFSLLDYNTFGHTQFRIKDSLLFAGDSVTVTLAPANSGTGRASLTAPVTQCTIHIITSCTTYSGRTTTSSVMPAPCTTYSYTFCTTTWPDPGGLGGGGGSGSGGGTPPDCPSGTGRSNLTDDPCGTGWEPVGDQPPPTQQPVDTILSKYSRKFRHIGDSIYNNHSLPGNKEYSFAGARNNTTNDTAILNIWTDNDSTAVTPYLSTPGHYLLFMWHSHVSTSQNTADRRSFSPADINYLRKPLCLRPNFVSFADCGNKQYALVITDAAKAQAFFAANDRWKIIDNYTTTGSGNMQEVDERCVKNVIGSAAANGISFYVSTDAPGFTNWTLLNP